MGKGLLDPEKAIDVFKYAACLLDIKDKACPPYLKSLLDKKHLTPTLKNRILVMSDPAITVQCLDALKHVLHEARCFKHFCFSLLFARVRKLCCVKHVLQCEACASGHLRWRGLN